ncbi:MAG: hypothetical protein K2Q10_06735, partial [Rhodospirillales bacterium]|nr:hypothetical protein [Rhodospirillales bacterium]
PSTLPMDLAAMRILHRTASLSRSISATCQAPTRARLVIRSWAVSRVALRHWAKNSPQASRVAR